jgi:prepilin-type N-terminal cleavage/methylation domain-containing protein
VNARKAERGLTLIEVMVATVVLLVAALGMLGLHATGVRLEGQAREITRATTIAQDLLAQIQLWEYADPRLANASTSNDADVADAALAFEAAGSTPPYDHAEAELSSGTYDWNGLPASALVAGGFERYWNVSEPDDVNGNGMPDGRRVAVIVRWPRGSGWHRIVLVGFKVNPQDRL